MALRKKLDPDGQQLKDKAGNLIWQADYYEGGKRRRPDIRGSKQYAMGVYAVLLKKVSPAPTSFARVKNLVPTFFVWFGNQGKSKNTITDMINTFDSQLIPFFGDYAISQVDAGLIKQYKDKRSTDKHQRKDAPVSRRTINKELSYFSSFLSYCEDDNIFGFDFKIKRFKKVGRPVPVPFTMAEIDRLLAVIKPCYRLPFLLMSDMGLRKSEALELKAEAVQGDVIHVHGKGDKTRVISITSPRLKDELKQAIKQHPSGYLITNPRTGKPYDSMKKELSRVLKSANNELKKAGKPLINKPIRHHLLRHSFGTNAIKTKSFSLNELREYMGHISISTTMLYVKLAAEALEAPAAKFGDYTVTKE